MYRLEVEGELSDPAGWAFHGMSLRYEHGNTVLMGPVRDQAELQGLLQRISDLGMTLVGVSALGRESGVTPRRPASRQR
jgi:hypothetical protein